MASILEEEKLEQELLDTIENSDLSKSEAFKQTEQDLEKGQQLNDELAKNQEKQKELEKEKELLEREQREQNEKETISFIDENTHQEKSIPLEEFKNGKEFEDYSFGSVNHQKNIEQNIKDDIENSPVYKKEIFGLAEQGNFQNKEKQKEIEQNQKRQKEIEQALNPNNKDKDKQNNQQLIQENNPKKSKEDLEKELTKLKQQEKDLKNELEENKANTRDNLAKMITANDINELLVLFVKICNQKRQKRTLEGKLKDNNENKRMTEFELKQIKLLEEAAKNLTEFVKNEENKEALANAMIGIVDDRDNATKNLQTISKAQDYQKEFSTIMSGYDKANDKNQAYKKQRADELFKQMEKNCPEYKQLYKKQFKEVQGFLDPKKQELQSKAKDKLKNLNNANKRTNQAMQTL